ncbi:MAG: hypothetical protein ACT6WE_16950, partial [Shinella sp.]
ITAGNGLSGGGTLTADRTVTLGTPGTLTNSTTNSVTTTSHTHAINLSAADVGAVPTSRSINANLGLLGGGDLSADRNISLGTPSSITNSTTNSVTTTTHTHALGFTAAEVYTGTSAGALTFGVGHTVSALGIATDRNDTASVYLSAATNTYTMTATGTALGGTWRARGRMNDYTLMQRTA